MAGLKKEGIFYPEMIDWLARDNLANAYLILVDKFAFVKRPK